MLFGAHLAAAEAALRDDRPEDAARLLGAIQGARSMGCSEPPAMFRFHDAAMQRLLERLRRLTAGGLESQLSDGSKQTFEEAVSASLACLPDTNPAETR